MHGRLIKESNSSFRESKPLFNFKKGQGLSYFDLANKTRHNSILMISKNIKIDFSVQNIPGNQNIQSTQNFKNIHINQIRSESKTRILIIEQKSLKFLRKLQKFFISSIKKCTKQNIFTRIDLSSLFLAR